MGVTLLTCTGGRPEAFERCEFYVRRQTYQDFRWIVVDDCEEPTAVHSADLVIRPEPRWSPGQHTVARNVAAGLEAVDDDGIVIFIEDDDWYHPDWVAFCVRQAEVCPLSCEAFGEGWTPYYNVHYRRWKVNTNARHASLCATVIRASFIPRLVEIAESYEKIDKYTVDMGLFRAANNPVITDTNFVIGVKGLPGRPGCVKGHTPQSMSRFEDDPSLAVLKSWIGDDASWYGRFFDGNFVVPEPAIPRRHQRRRMLAGKALEIANAKRLRR